MEVVAQIRERVKSQVLVDRAGTAPAPAVSARETLPHFLREHSRMP
jgi:hypothetical protein